MTSTEMIMRRRNVTAFVENDPVDIVIQRFPAPTKTLAGGTVRSSPVTLAPQQAQLVLSRRRITSGIVNSEAGDIPTGSYFLIGKYGMDIQASDQFISNGDRYEVTSVFKQRTESVLAIIILLGPVDGS